MKKMIMAATAAMLATSAMAFDVSVGAERATKAGDNTLFVEAEHSVGGLTLTAKPEFNMNHNASGDRFETTKINLDAAYKLGKNISAYVENDFNKSFDRTETKVGVKYKF